MKGYMRIFAMALLVISFLTVSPKAINASSEIRVFLEGQELKFDVPPQIIEGRTLLPLRIIFEALGLEIGWDNTTKVITGTAKGKELILKLGSKNAKVNGIDKMLDVPAKAINGRTMVPIRFIAESLDMNLAWNQESKTLKIESMNKVEIEKDKYNQQGSEVTNMEYSRDIGNTNGNLSNSGLLAEFEDWIFYSNKNDGGSLWRMNKDGTGKIKLVDNYVSSINVVGDGWVYYLKDQYNSDLYKCRYDGRDNTHIYTLSNPNNINGKYYTIYSYTFNATVEYDEWIYYQNLIIYVSNNDTYIDGSYIYKIRKNGKDNTRLIDDEFYISCLSNGWIYYRDSQDALYRMKTDGTSKTKIFTGRVDYHQVVNDTSYFIDKDNKKIYKIDADGKNKKQISTDYAEKLHVTEDGWIYYVNDVDRGMYRIRIDGSQRKKLTDNPVSDINIVNGWIYYYDEIEEGWFKITRKGESRTSWND